MSKAVPFFSRQYTKVPGLPASSPLQNFEDRVGFPKKVFLKSKINPKCSVKENKNPKTQ